MASRTRTLARLSPTAAPDPTYPANVMDLPHFSALEVKTYFVEPDATDIQVSYTIPAEGWISWFGAGNPEQGIGCPPWTDATARSRRERPR